LSSTVCTKSRLAITARKLAALNQKADAMPKAAMTTPASAGPTVRLACVMEEFSAIAQRRSCGPARSPMKTGRLAISRVASTPSTLADTYSCHTSTASVWTSTASATATSIATTCSQMSSLRRSHRSAHVPAWGARIRNGKNVNMPTVPSAAVEWVSFHTSHAWPADCIQVPSSETA